MQTLFTILDTIKRQNKEAEIQNSLDKTIATNSSRKKNNSRSTLVLVTKITK